MTKLTVNDVAFNSNKSLLILSTNCGYLTYNLSNSLLTPIKLSGSLGKVQKLDTLTVCTGGELNSYMPSNVFSISQSRLNSNVTRVDTKNKILNLFIVNDITNKKTEPRIIIVLSESIRIYDNVGKLLVENKTYKNPNGICDVCNISNGNILISCLGNKQGELKLWNYTMNTSNTLTISNTDLQLIKLSFTGNLVSVVADSSIIHVHKTSNGLPVKSLRRGTDIFSKAIYDIAFCNNDKVLACSSSNSTVHIFSLSDEKINKTSVFGFAKNYLPEYFSSEWAFKKIKLDDSSKSMCVFDSQNQLHVCTFKGDYYKISGEKYMNVTKNQLLKQLHEICENQKVQPIK